MGVLNNMALVKATLQGELIATYGGHSPDPMKPGKDIAKAFKNYLMMALMLNGRTTGFLVYFLYWMRMKQSFC